MSDYVKRILVRSELAQRGYRMKPTVRRVLLGELRGYRTVSLPFGSLELDLSDSYMADLYRQL